MCFLLLFLFLLQASCSEEVDGDEIQTIISSEQPNAQDSFKEHVLLCVRVRVEGRAGVVLLDPGYHVPCPVTVMQDGLSPHSGPVLTATTRSDVKRTFTYHFPTSTSSYVIWEAEEERKGTRKTIRNVIHVSRPYLSSVDVTERRNLVYPFKTLMGRDAAGKFTTGLYFIIKPSSSSSSSSIDITLLHKINGEFKQVKTPLTYFLPNEEEEDYIIEKEEDEKGKKKKEVNEEVEEAVLALEKGVGRARGDVRNTLVILANILKDKIFLSDLLELNKFTETLFNV